MRVLRIVKTYEHFRIRSHQQQHAIVIQNPGHLAQVSLMIPKVLRIFCAYDELEAMVRECQRPARGPFLKMMDACMANLLAQIKIRSLPTAN